MLEYISIDILINVVLAVITLSLGLTLTKQNFTNLLLNPKALTVGLASQLIILPLVGFGVLHYFDFDPVMKVGFIVITLCPGGATSNLITFMMNGNVALSISLTILNSVVTLFTIPALTLFAQNLYLDQTDKIDMPFWDAFTAIFLVTLLPATIGVAIRYQFPRFAKKIYPILRYILPVLLFTIFGVKIFGKQEDGGVQLSMQEFFEILPATLLLNLIGMLAGLVVGSILLVKFKNRITILVEVGLQNTAMALLVTGVLLGNPEMEKPAIVYAAFSFFSTLLAAWIFKSLFFKWKKHMKREVHPSEY